MTKKVWSAELTRPLYMAWMASIILTGLATLSILTIQPFISGISFAPDQGFNWYFWKRPDPDFWSRASVWGAYVLHQLFIWGLIAWAKAHRDQLKNRNKLHGVNVVAIAGTAFFVLLHYVQTAVFYDGLGQDLPVFTSQASVILLLVVVLLMEAPRRGLVFGKGKRLFGGVRETLIRYHGYYFAWAITFTYWYHPMETTGGHLLGFFYTMLLFVQAAFIFTRVHSNRYWTLFLEVMVLVHGVTVALVAGQEFWTMFFFGFFFLFVVTQMHGIGLATKWKWVIGVSFVAAILAVYAQRGWGNLNEVLRIPVIDYLLVFVLAGLIFAGQWVVRRLRTTAA